MPQDVLYSFLAGCTAMGYALAGVFFLRFFIRTRDSLFLAFCAAFWLMALSQSLVVLMDLPQEERSPIYLLRAAAFLIIIIAVVLKNWRNPGPARD